MNIIEDALSGNLSKYPDFIMIELAQVEEDADDFHDFLYAGDVELGKRQPHFEPEYDSEGRVITSELIGYSEGVEVWSSPISQS